MATLEILVAKIMLDSQADQKLNAESSAETSRELLNKPQIEVVVQSTDAEIKNALQLTGEDFGNPDSTKKRSKRKLNKEYEYVGDVSSEGMRRVVIDGKVGYVDEKGREMIPVKYEEAWGFSEGLAIASLDGKKWGHIDKTGKEVIPMEYDRTLHFSEGLAAVKLNGKWGYLDTKGQVVIDFKYKTAGMFSGGKASVQAQTQKNGHWFDIDIDRQGKEVQ